MKRRISRLTRLLRPPKWVLLGVSPAVFASLAFVLSSGRNDGIPAYLLYGMSAYCLAVCLLPLPGLFRGARAAIVRVIRRSAFGDRLLSDPALRGGVGLCLSLLANLLYAGFRAVVGLRYASAWSLSAAVYYLALSAIRLPLLQGYRRGGEIDGARVCRKTARRLLWLTLPMGGMIAQMVWKNAGYSYPGYVIYLSAMYTFYSAIETTVRFFRLRGLADPLLSAAKAVSLAAALMSVLGLQTAMLAQFSGRGDGFRQTMNALTGGGVWLCVILTAVCMLRRCAKEEDRGECR